MSKHGIRILFCLLAVFLLFRPVFADTAGRQILDNLYLSPGKLPVNDLIIDAEVYTPIEKNVRDTTSGSALSLSGRDKMMFKKPNKLRVDSIIHDPGGPQDGKQVTIIRNGVMSFMYLAVGQYPVRKRADTPSPTLNLPPYLQTYKQDANNTYSIKGKEKVGNTEVTVVKVDNVNGESSTIWVDTVRWVPLKLERAVPNPKGDKPIVKTCLYRDFKQLKDGRWFPFVIEIKTGDITTTLVKYTALSINVGVKDDLFEPMRKFTR